MKMNDKRYAIVEKMRAKGWRWVRELSTSAYWRYCYYRRYKKVNPPEKKVDLLVFITQELFDKYENPKPRKNRKN